MFAFAMINYLTVKIARKAKLTDKFVFHRLGNDVDTKPEILAFEL